MPNAIVYCTMISWDPVFQPDGFEGTFAELSSEVSPHLSPLLTVYCLLSDCLVGIDINILHNVLLKVKNTISHRFLSLSMLRDHVAAHRDEIVAAIQTPASSSNRK